MRNILILSAIILGSSSLVSAYPNVDMSPMGTSFMLMQQQHFQQTEANHLRRFTDAYEKPIENRMDDVEQLQDEYKIKNLKQPTKIELGKKKQELPAVPKEQQLIQKDGKIFIKQTTEVGDDDFGVFED